MDLASWPLRGVTVTRPALDCRSSLVARCSSLVARPGRLPRRRRARLVDADRRRRARTGRRAAGLGGRRRGRARDLPRRRRDRRRGGCRALRRPQPLRQVARHVSRRRGIGRQRARSTRAVARSARTAHTHARSGSQIAHWIDRFSSQTPRPAPRTEADVVAPCGRDELECTYEEGLFVGYRALDRDGTAVRFPFGHGLSFTTFEFAWSSPPALAADGKTATMTIAVANVGGRAGAEVVHKTSSPTEAR